jgi:hypothetical protein
MRVATVESTTLATVGYDETRKLLQLEFCSRAVYLYFGVPGAVHQALLDAPSKGGYFNEAVRGRYPFRRMLDVNPVPRSAAIAARWDR